MRFLYIILLLLFSSNLNARDVLPFAEMNENEIDSQAAWWFNITYNPSGKFVYNIPISKIDSDWCEAELFSPEKFPPEISDYIKNAFTNDELAKYFKSSKMTFTTSEFSAGKYHHLVASVGIYRQCKSSKTGTFLLVIDNKNINKPKIIF